LGADKQFAAGLDDFDKAVLGNYTHLFVHLLIVSVVSLQLLHIDPRAALHVPAGESLQDDPEGWVFEHLVQSGVRVKRAVRNFKGRSVGRDALHGQLTCIR
jgi:hypothetical protein